MTYYFSLHNLNVKDFWSDKTIFGGAVVLISPNESRMMFKCDFVRKRKDADCSVFKIELELDEVNKYVHNDRLRIKLANVTGNSNSRSVTWTSLYKSDVFPTFASPTIINWIFWFIILFLFFFSWNYIYFKQK